MSENDATPLVTFVTRMNTELGAGGIKVVDDGQVVMVNVLKKVTEAMLTSYARSMLGKWTPNRAAIRYPRQEIALRRVTKFDTGDELDLDGVLALAD